MVLLAAAVCTKVGKAIVSRQFVEMSKSRIEGLLAAFPKLMSTGKQHTFVETESVRYVYQPLEKLYMLLITTKASNILEDLETLRLFSRVIPEYCRVMEESEIIDNAFQLIFAFDEIVALGYRENVNLAQIRTFTEMDSHEEKVFQAVRQTQEREAKENMRKKAKELQQKRTDAARRGVTPGFGGGFGSSSVGSVPSPVVGDSSYEPATTPIMQYIAPSKPMGPSKAMKLGSKGKDIDSFVDQLKSEGQEVLTNHLSKTSAAITKITTPAINKEGVHMRIEEKISLSAGRDGGLQNMEVLGIIMLQISDEHCNRIRVKIDNKDNKGVQLQTHPNIDKKLFQSESIISLKNPAKPFPLNTDIGVLKWRFQTQDEAFMPLSINCWPSQTGSGCDVNIEYTLEQEQLELSDVVVIIPLPAGSGNPVVTEYDGQYSHDKSRAKLEWQIPVVDKSNKSGSMEFSIGGGSADDFFPVSVSFVSKKSYCDLLIDDVIEQDSTESVRYSTDIAFYVDKYEVV
ncbi:PREDICTED: coatomer subunit delta-like [Priapulus caudatus]|uniref:Coatomer subunit delta n=1 Tax=Priapulus caudatus TaxID=37621 RepID=A0ABM1DYA4_PRICU|nr:PREDICTED: coatomer subunit delta-like [Priapulus caudatus]